jgi:hypothetical protein
MNDLTDESGSDDDDFEEKSRLKMAKEIARRQSEPATHFSGKARVRKVSARARSPPPGARNRKHSSSTEEDGEIPAEGD